MNLEDKQFYKMYNRTLRRTYVNIPRFLILIHVKSRLKESPSRNLKIENLMEQMEYDADVLVNGLHRWLPLLSERITRFIPRSLRK